MVVSGFFLSIYNTEKAKKLEKRKMKSSASAENPENFEVAKSKKESGFVFL